MQVLITKLVRKTASALGLVDFVTCYSSQFARDIRYLEFGLSLDGSYSISHHGLTISSIWYIRSNEEEEAKTQQNSERFAGATITMTEDMARQQEKPG